MTTNAQLIFNQIPKGEPTPETFKYNTENTIDLEQKLDNGAHIVKIICVSLDPYMRGRMRPAEVKSYSPAFELHKPLTGHGVGVVIRAAADSQYKVGDHVYGMVPYQQFVFYPGQQKVDEETKKFLGPQVGLRVIKNEEGLPWVSCKSRRIVHMLEAYLGLHVVVCLHRCCRYARKDCVHGLERDCRCQKG
jgi:NADPH-dependent curcumin reductase CurA